MVEQYLRIPKSGFKIKVRQMIINRDDACNILTPGMQMMCTRAVRGERNITITKHVVACQYCNNETPAYNYYLKKGKSNYQVKSDREIDKWSTRQISMFGEMPKKIMFNIPVTMLDKFVCPLCQKLLFPKKGVHEISIRTQNKVIKVMLKVELKELFLLKWIKDEMSITDFPLYEVLTFNLKNGHTFLSLEDGCNNKLKVFDISNINPIAYREDPIFNLIEQYKMVHRALKKQFEQIQPIPFQQSKITLDKFILLTRFVGYNTAFFSAIPYADNKLLIAKGFLNRAKRLHFAKNIPILIEKSNLPNVKSIRKILFDNPGLLFYIRELEQFWTLIDDVNIFRILEKYR